MDRYGERFEYDPMYNEHYYSYWRELPTPDMRRRALPDGVLESGGRAEGWFYFEKVQDNVDRLTFRADLVHAETGRQFGEIR